MQLVGSARDSTVLKYIKSATLDGKSVTAHVDMGSAECTICASTVLTLGLHMNAETTPLKPWGPSEIVVHSLGKIRAEVSIDDVCVKDVEFQVVPDDYQGTDVFIGRTFTDHDSVDYEKTGAKFSFHRSWVLPTDCVEQVGEMRTNKRAAIPPNSIAFIAVNTHDGPREFPFVNWTKKEQVMPKGELTIRGELATIATVARSEPRNAAINPEDVIIGDEQPATARAEVLALLNEFRDCILVNLHDLGCAKDIVMDIKLKEGASPVCCKPYHRVTPTERETIREIVSEWRDAGIVTDAESPYASPVLLVKKKTGESRLCVDFRKLNAVTERIHFPLPNIDDLLAQIRDSALFIVLDLAHGYLQIPLSPDARAKTAIITTKETVEFTRMVFGLVNGPAYFSKAMHRALGPLRDRVALFYLDDILIPGRDWSDLKPKLWAVLERLRMAGLTLKLAKCRFLSSKVAYLGHEISANGIEPGMEKTKAIKEFPPPRNVHEIRRFLGLTSYFRKFVPHFASIASPLSALLKTNEKFVWGPDQSNAFNTLKEKLTVAPVLQTFNPSAETELHTDASAAGLAGMFFQHDGEGRMRLAYAISRRTSEPERRYHSGKLELMAIVRAVSRLRAMLANVEFTIVTDCQALCFLDSQKTLNPQVIRWHDLLSEYNYKIVHRPGVKLAHVDALSRAPAGEPEETEALGVFAINTDEEIVAVYQHGDKQLQIKRDILSKPVSARTKYEQSCVEDYELRGGVLNKNRDGRQLFVVPTKMRKSIVTQFHDLKSHPGAKRTAVRILDHYYFPGVRNYVKRHIRACIKCVTNKSKPGRQPGELHPIPPGRRPSAVVHMDHLGPFVASSKGNKYILVIVDNLSKFVVIRAVRDARAASTVRVLNEFVENYGAPERVVSDRGTCFTSTQFNRFCNDHGIQHTLNSPRHPQANGQVERVNATLVAAIRSNLTDGDGRTWDRGIRSIQLDLNEMRNASTGKSPFEIVYGL